MSNGDIVPMDAADIEAVGVEIPEADKAVGVFAFRYNVKDDKGETTRIEVTKRIMFAADALPDEISQRAQEVYRKVEKTIELEPEPAPPIADRIMAVKIDKVTA